MTGQSRALSFSLLISVGIIEDLLQLIYIPCEDSSALIQRLGRLEFIDFAAWYLGGSLSGFSLGGVIRRS